MVAPADAAADHAAAGQNGLDLALGARAHVGVDQPPLPAAAEPDPARGLEWSDKRLGVGFGPIARVQHGHVLHAETAGRSSVPRLFTSTSSPSSRRRDQHKFGVRPPGQGDEPFSRSRRSSPRRRSPASPERDRPWCDESG